MSISLVRPTLKEAGFTALQLSVERKNEPSKKTILKNGGQLKRSFEYEGEMADVYIIEL